MSPSGAEVIRQIKSQIAAVNKDFRSTNPDTSKVPAPWKGLVADSKIKFQLATTDPDGKKTNGVVRVETDRNSFGPGGEGFARMCYATEYSKIEEALHRMEKFMNRYG